LAVAALLAAVVSGCATTDRSEGPGQAPPVIRIAPPEARLSDRKTDAVKPSRCPASLRGCRSVRGEIVYIEGSDSDGDGDAHFVIADSGGITLPGLTAVEVVKGLRPHPLPRAGDLVSAAGPVQDGSLGESEIRALEVHVAAPGGR
jgi:hypothetical protein